MGQKEAKLLIFQKVADETSPLYVALPTRHCRICGNLPVFWQAIETAREERSKTGKIENVAG